MEFLLGRLLESNLINLRILELCREGLHELGIDLDDIIVEEPDAGLGNGGLGRLAACFLDSLASLGLPGHGCGIRYKSVSYTHLDVYKRQARAMIRPSRGISLPGKLKG